MGITNANIGPPSRGFILAHSVTSPDISWEHGVSLPDINEISRILMLFWSGQLSPLSTPVNMASP
jgi:hypothetical protein